MKTSYISQDYSIDEVSEETYYIINKTELNYKNDDNYINSVL